MFINEILEANYYVTKELKNDMGKVKEALAADAYIENVDPEQVIDVGDTVRVYDSTALLAPYEAQVLYRKNVGQSVILDIEPCTPVRGKEGVRQVFEIQCRKVSKRLPRILWLRFNNETQEYEVKTGRPSEQETGWAMFKEEI